MPEGTEPLKTDESPPKSTLGTLIKREGAVKLIVFLGAAGIGLILISSLFGGGGKSREEGAEDSISDYRTALEYKQELCDELGNMVASIEGAGNTKVMVTLDGTVRSIYATDNDIKSTGTGRNTGGTEESTAQNDEKKKCIVMRRSDGSEQALTIGQLMPKVSGVLVVCQGGDRSSVKKSITSAVSAALAIDPSQICVSKMS